MSQTVLRIDTLRLQNYRCFASCAVDFHERLTVIVGDNGRGKSALLQGLATILGLVVDTATAVRQFRRYGVNDIRMVRADDGRSMTRCLPIVCSATGFAASEKADWSCTGLFQDPMNPTNSQARQALRLGANAPQRPDAATVLPVVAHYGTGQTANERYGTNRDELWRNPANARLRGYLDCLCPLASFTYFEEWYEKRTREIHAAQAGGTPADGQRAEKLLAAVRAVTEVVLEPTGWTALDWDADLKQLVAEHPDQGRYPLHSQSDGVRTMLALVGDLAQRCTRLNPHLGEHAPAITPGVVLIDEVDLHLHPSWQQRVVGLLQKAFPAVQWVLTTHSPQVLSTVCAESIRVLRLRDGDALVETPKFQTRGVESADVLAAIMGVDPVPRVEEALLLSDYRALIEAGKNDTPEAEPLRARLVGHFGPQHPLILDCDRLIRFAEFKRRPKREG